MMSLILCDDFSQEIMERKISENYDSKITILPDIKEKYFFIFIDQLARQKLKHEKKIDTYKLKAYIKNGIDFIYSNKVILYNYFKNNKYFPNNIIVDKETDENKIRRFLNKDYIFILKPEETTKGNGIIISKDNNQILKNIKKLKKKAILSEYISSPLLYKYKNKKDKDIVSLYKKEEYKEEYYKFHLRLYVIISISDKKINYTFCEKGRIILSERPYENKNYDDKRIHDTHSKEDVFLVYPDDMKIFKDKNKIIHNIDKMIIEVFDEIFIYANNYPEEADIGYDILGIDVMIDKDYKPYILEINQRVDAYKNKINNDNIMEDISDNIIYSINQVK
jgi:hypothetical protein